MEANLTPQSSKVRTKRAILDFLKQQGATDAQVLAQHLSISAMAVRQHLYALQKEQLVTYTSQQRSQGRPAKLWQLTPQANRFFPDGYAHLSVSLINSMGEAFGEEGLERLLEVRTRQQKQYYQQQIPDGSWKERVEALAQLRTQEGYMAQVEGKEDGSLLLIENHCPICIAAQACMGLCSGELELFEHVLGEEVKLERTEHILAGERRCVYHITKP